MKKLCLLSATWMIILFHLSTAQAALVTLTPDDKLEISFSLPLPSPSTYDVFSMFISKAGSTGSNIISSDLFNGATLLGSYTSSYNSAASRWTTSSSAFTFDNPTFIDFSSFWDGSIDGLVRVSITGSGSVTFDTDTIEASVGQGVNSSGVSGNLNFNPTINSITVSSVPVPAAVWLFGSGLLGFIGIARRKKT